MDTFIIWLRERLQKKLPGKVAQLKMVPPASRELRLKPMVNPKRSSVLLLLFKRNALWHTVFIKRPEYSGYHSGQISLPGGKMEVGDPDLQFTALRETFEEVGVNSSDVTVIGKLSTVQIPISGFIVEPYIGVIAYEPNFIPEPKEVSKIITTEIDLFVTDDVKDSFNYSSDSISFEAPYYKLAGEKLWGATAMMISEFEELLRECPKN